MHLVSIAYLVLKCSGSSLNGVSVFHVRQLASWNSSFNSRFDLQLRTCIANLNRKFQGLFLTLIACGTRTQCPFWILYGFFILHKLQVFVLFRGVSSSNCPKFTKICPFLLIPRACPTILKDALNLFL